MTTNCLKFSEICGKMKISLSLLLILLFLMHAWAPSLAVTLKCCSFRTCWKWKL